MKDDPLTKTVEEERKKREELYGNGTPQDATPDTTAEPDATPAPQGKDTPPAQDAPAAPSSPAALPDFDSQFSTEGGNDEGSELERLREENKQFKIREGSAAGRLKKSSEESAETIRQLQADLAERDKRLKALESARPGGDKFLTPEELENIDDGVRSVISKVATGVASEERAKLADDFKRLEQRVTENEALRQQDRRLGFNESLMATVPDVGSFATNSNPKWVEFLKQRIPMGKETIGLSAARAYHNCDVTAFVEILNAYKHHVGEPPIRNSDVLSRTRPDTSRTAVQPSDNAELKTYTKREYIEHWNQWLGNPAMAKDKDSVALHEDILKARDEGRITG